MFFLVLVQRFSSVIQHYVRDVFHTLRQHISDPRVN